MVIKRWNPDNESTEFIDNIIRLDVMRTEIKEKKQVIRELILHIKGDSLPMSIRDTLDLTEDERITFSPIWIMSDVGKTIERIN